MALTKSRTFKADPDTIYIAWQSGATDTYAWRRGERLRGDHAAVQQMGRAAFILDGTPESEWPSMFDAAVEAADARPQPKPKPKPQHFDASTPIDEFLVAHQGVIASAAGSFSEGIVVHRSDPRAMACPGQFRPLMDALVHELPARSLQGVFGA